MRVPGIVPRDPMQQYHPRLGGGRRFDLPSVNLVASTAASEWRTHRPEPVGSGGLMGSASGQFARQGLGRKTAQAEIERIAEVLLLLEVAPERASRGLTEICRISENEAADIVRTAVTR